MSEIKQITAKELQKKLAKGDNIFLLDVREDFEHEAFNIGGMLIPLGEVNQKSELIPTDKEVVVYCRKGIRSIIAIQKLQQKGFANLVNLHGGIAAWNDSFHNH